ncbi:MAG: hypothetical protein WCK51_15375 [Armatimonadota bacterium]
MLRVQIVRVVFPLLLGIVFGVANGQTLTTQKLGGLTIDAPEVKPSSSNPSITEHRLTGNGFNIIIAEDNLKANQYIEGSGKRYYSSADFYEATFVNSLILPSRWTVAFQKNMPLGSYEVLYGTVDGRYCYKFKYGKFFIWIDTEQSLKQRDIVWKIISSIKINSTGEAPLQGVPHPTQQIRTPSVVFNIADAPEVKGNTTKGILIGGAFVGFSETIISDSPTHYADALRIAQAVDPKARPVKYFDNGFILLRVASTNSYSLLWRVGTHNYTVAIGVSSEEELKKIITLTDASEEEARAPEFFGPVGGHVRHNKSASVEGLSYRVWSPFAFTEGKAASFGDVGERMQTESEEHPFAFFIMDCGDKFANRAEGEASLFDKKYFYPKPCFYPEHFGEFISAGYRWVTFGNGRLAMHVRSIARIKNKASYSGSFRVNDIIILAGKSPKVITIRGNRSATHAQRAQKVLRSLSFKNDEGQYDYLFSDETYDQPFNWYVAYSGTTFPVSDIPQKGTERDGESVRFNSVLARANFALTSLGMAAISAVEQDPRRRSLVDTAMADFSTVDGSGTAKLSSGREIGFAFGGKSLIIELSGSGTFTIGFLFPDQSKIIPYIEEHLLKGAKNVKVSWKPK